MWERDRYGLRMIPVVPRGLRTFFELQEALTVLGEAVDGFEAPWLIGESRPDMVLLDLKVPRTGGVAPWNVWPMARAGRG